MVRVVVEVLARVGAGIITITTTMIIIIMRMKVVVMIMEVLLLTTATIIIMRTIMEGMGKGERGKDVIAETRSIHLILMIISLPTLSYRTFLFLHSTLISQHTYIIVLQAIHSAFASTQ